MNIQLPKTNSSRQGLASLRGRSGFTLIELLVVISIIAVLAVIAAVIFSGVQSRARDAKRRADVTAIAKAYEAQKVAGSTTYTASAVGWFAGGAVPIEASTDRNYILIYSTVAGAVVGAPGAWTAQTPAVNPTAAGGTTVATFAAALPATITSFQACALLENPANTAFCVPNAQ